VHELLTTAAAIRSTASILAEDKTITEEWRNKFHANIDQDSRRLSDSSKALVGYLDATEHASDAQSVGSPQDELDAFLEAHDYTFAGIEAGAETADDVLQNAPQLMSVGAKHIARLTLERLQSDAKKVSLDVLRGEMVGDQLDPIVLARQFDVPMSLILRRLAALPDLQTGLVVCDRSGSFVFRKPVSGFAIPRFGAACPLWPLFDVFALPGQVARRRVQQVGRGSAEFDCFAVAEAAGHTDYNNAPLVQATMLIVPVPANAATPVDEALQVGSTCRVCARAKCSGRREPSILSEGF
jgi:predicted transcriptional regulator